MPANLVVLPSLSFLPTFPSLFCFYLLKPPTCFFFPLLILSGMLSFFYFTNFFFKATRKNFYMCSFFPITPCFLPPDLAVLPTSYLPPRLPVCSACSTSLWGPGPALGPRPRLLQCAPFSPALFLSEHFYQLKNKVP